MKHKAGIVRNHIAALLTLALAGQAGAQPYLMQNGVTVNACSGKFYDDGGAGSNYSTPNEKVMTICSDDHSQCLEINFISVGIYYADGDIFEVYDGPDLSSPLLKQIHKDLDNGEFIPCIYASGQCLTFRFKAGNSSGLSKTGWDADISCGKCGSDSLVVDNTVNPVSLVQSLFSQDVKVSNVTVNCPNGAVGAFQSSSDCIGLKKGMIITTGWSSLAPGPNNKDGAGYDHKAPGDACLNELLPKCQPGGPCSQPGCMWCSGSVCQQCEAGSGQTFDACAIEFDVKLCETLVIDYVFASEEYLEFVGSKYNDIFAFFISGPGISGQSSCGQNIALVPGTNQPVAINTINQNTNSQYYNNNDEITSGKCSKYRQCTQYDGFTLPLKAELNVNPCETYHIKIVIADVGDGILDAAVFLGEGGITCSAPVADFTANNVCLGDTTYFNSSGNVSQWEWYFGDGATASEGNPAHLYGSPGTYNVKLVIGGAAGCGGDTIEKTVQVFAPPQVDAGPDAVACNSANLSATGSGTFTWSPPDGLSCTNCQNPIATPTATTTYYVTVTGANGCTASDSVTVTLSCGPTVTVNSGEICAGACMDITATPAGGIPPYTFTWSGGISGTTAGPFNVCPSATTTYSVTVTDNGGNPNNASGTVTVNPLPTATTSGTDATCGNIDGSACVNAAGGTPGYTYQWSNSGSGTCIGNIGGGTYTVTVTDAKGCTVTATRTVNESGAPTAQMTDSTDATCKGLCNGSATVTGTGGNPPYTYSWNDAATQTTPTANNLCAGTYSACILDNIGCKVCVLVTIKEPTAVVLSTTGTDESCSQSNGSVTVSPSGGTPGYTYLWNDPAGQTGVTATGLSAGSYCVTVTDQNGCSKSICQAIANVPGPTPLHSGNDVCVGGTTAFTYGSTGNIATCSWDFGDASAPLTTCGAVNHTYSSAGTYAVTHCVADAGGCQACYTDSVTVYPIPVVCFSDSLTGCVPITATFSSGCSTGGSTYAWNFGDNTTSDQANPAHTYTQPGCYDVSLRVTSPAGCWKDTVKTCYIQGYPIPKADFAADPWEVTIINPFVDFTDKSTANPTAWYWDFGDGGTSLVQNPTHTYEDTGCYNVMLALVNQWGCVDTTNKVICVKDIFTIYIPNAFSPNGDTRNEWFTVEQYGICEFELYIFDRWGNLIYQTTSLKGWDGTANRSAALTAGSGGEVVQEDVYVWKIRATDCYGKKINKIGHVTVIK